MGSLIWTMVMICGLIEAADHYTFYKLLDVDKDVFLNAHNYIREYTASGKYTHLPRGQIKDLKWDEKLARVARQWVEACDEKGHSSDEFRNKISGYDSVGENMAFSTQPEDRMLDKSQVAQIAAEHIKRKGDLKAVGWSDDEAPHFKYGVGGAFTAHFKQVIWADTTHVGCAVGYCLPADRSQLHKFVINCNYYPKGNFGEKPYSLLGEKQSDKKDEAAPIIPDKNYRKKPAIRNNGTKKFKRQSQNQISSNSGSVKDDMKQSEKKTSGRNPSARRCRMLLEAGWTTETLKQMYKNCKSADYCSSKSHGGVFRHCREWCKQMMSIAEDCGIY